MMHYTMKDINSDIEQIKTDAENGCQFAKNVIMLGLMYNKGPKDQGAFGILEEAYEDWKKKGDK